VGYLVESSSYGMVLTQRFMTTASDIQVILLPQQYERLQWRYY
jgi:hypothetical protein